VERYLELGVVLVAVLRTEIVGEAQILEAPGGAVRELKSLAVLAEHRGRGIGSLLVRASLAHARREGAARMVVATATADLDNVRFYQRLGFRMAWIERDVFTPDAGYPEGLAVDGIPVRDRVWLDQPLEHGTPPGN